MKRSLLAKILSVVFVFVSLMSLSPAADVPVLAADDWTISFKTKSQGGILTREEVNTQITIHGLGPDNTFSATFDGSVKVIGDDAFSDCLWILKNVVISDSVTSIGDKAFFNCLGLKSLVIGNNVTTINSNAFAVCQNLKSVIVPDSVTTIGSFAFNNCSGITSVIIGNGVTNIEERAFFACTSLTGVNIGSSVESIGDWAFELCTNLESVTIPGSVKHIGGGSFAGCSKLTEIIVSAENKNFLSENGVLFNKAKTVICQYPAGKSGDYIIPGSVKIIACAAFNRCPTLTNVIIPDSVVDIDDSAFTGGESLKSIEIGNSVKRIGDFAFAGCVNLMGVNLPNNLKEIGNAAFLNCSDLGSVVIPNSVITIGATAFERCTSLKSVVIGNSVKAIDGWAFQSCTNLSEIYFNGDAPKIGDGSFEYLTSNPTVYVYPLVAGFPPEGKLWHGIVIKCRDMKTIIPLTDNTNERPTEWAETKIYRAILLDLVPNSLQSLYKQTITRAEFCALAVALYEKNKIEDITERVQFTDTDDVNVEKMAAVGVVFGVSPGKFAPNSDLTREQAATMLTRLANAIGKPLDKKEAIFADNSSISDWALEAIGQMQAAGIMNGVSPDTFAPKSAYTREQSIVTILRMYDMLK